MEQLIKQRERNKCKGDKLCLKVSSCESIVTVTCQLSQMTVDEGIKATPAIVHLRGQKDGEETRSDGMQTQTGAAKKSELLLSLVAGKSWPF